MQLNIFDLYRRHEYWRHRIAEAGIWDAEKFLPVAILIRKHHKSYNGVFQRKWTRGNKANTLSDKIIIYNNAEDFEESFINSVLVHEMIHQYIIQNDIKDSSTHGKIFKSFMNSINRHFAGSLEISLKTNNPSLPLKGEGARFHTLLIMETDKEFFCCVVNINSLKSFEMQLRRNKKLWGVKKHSWAVSNDIFFNRFSKCVKRLHGVRKPLSELKSFIEEYNITTVKN